MARFDQGAVCYLRLRHRLVWTVWYLVEWSDLGKGDYGMHRGTRAALSFRSSVRSAVGLLRGVVLLLAHAVVLLARVVLHPPRVVVHPPRVVALPEAVSQSLKFR